MKTTRDSSAATYLYIGQEATGVAVCAALAPEDYVFSTHRNHGHVIAKGGDPKKVLAEIIGRETGYCLGRAETFHVAAPDLTKGKASASAGSSAALVHGSFPRIVEPLGDVAALFALWRWRSQSDRRLA